MAFIGLGNSSKPEAVRNHKGIDLIGLLFIGISSFEVSDELGIELVEGGMKGSQSLRGGQKVDEVEIEERGGLGSDFDLREPLLVQRLEEPGLQGLSAREGVGEGLSSEGISFRIHETDGMAFGTDVTAYE
jgi:hypothetical protein